MNSGSISETSDSKAQENGEELIDLEVDKVALATSLAVFDLEIPQVTHNEAALLNTDVDEMSEKQLFTSIPLSARLTKGVRAVTKLSEKQLEKTMDLVAKSLQKDNKHLPPEARITKLDSAGLCWIKFTKRINVPDDVV